MHGSVHVADGQEASGSLIDGKSALLDAIGVGECLRCIFIRPRRHQQIASIGVNHRILRLEKNELLEIQKSLARIANEVGALSSEEVGVKQLVVELYDFCEIGDCLLEHREAGVAPTFVQQVCCVGLLLSGGGPL